MVKMVEMVEMVGMVEMVEMVEMTIYTRSFCLGSLNALYILNG